MPMISVVIPSYKPQGHTIECLDSLKCQTLAPELFEVLVILNGDRDPYYAMLEQAMPVNGRLLYSPVASACSSRNMGIDSAQGDYICFIDDDDRVSPTYLEEMHRLAAGGVVVASYCLSFDDSGQEWRNAYSAEYDRYAPRGIQPFHHPKKVFSMPWMKLIPRTVIGDRRFNGRFPSGQDALLMFEISDRMDQIVFTPDTAVYYWRQRSGSLHRMPFARLVSKYCRLAWAYTRLYFRHPCRYRLGFYLTRVLASVHAIMVRK